MSACRFVLAVLLALLLPGLEMFAGKDDAKGALAPRTVTLEKKGISLAEALAQIHEQTGSNVADRRLSKTDAKLNLKLVRAPFWQALEVIAKGADARISPYQADGSIALVDGPYRPAPVHVHGPFRIAVKRLTLDRNLETGTHSCLTQLEVCWEPWFQPFYLDAGPATAVYSPDADGKAAKSSVPGRGQFAVAGKNAVEIETRFPAPKRSSARIDLLQGNFRIIGPTKMLTFAFRDLKPLKNTPMRKEQEGVAVSLTRIVVKPERWTFDVLIENPPGGPKFESYQSWLDNNQIWLEQGAGKNRKLFHPNPAQEETLGNVTATRAAIRYHFTPANGGRTMPGNIDTWHLIYRTPGRIVEVPVPFEFKDLKLP